MRRTGHDLVRVLRIREIVVWIALPLLAGGCCWAAKRSCFSPCPPPQAPKIITIEKPCALPPVIKLPAVKRVACPAGALVACFDAAGAGSLAHRDASMKDWIKEARSRCGGVPASLPASRPR